MTLEEIPVKSILPLVVPIGIALCLVAHGQDTVHDTVFERPNDDRLVIAIPPFVAAPGFESVARELAPMMAYDLEFTGLFFVLPSNSYPPGFTGFTANAGAIDFRAWKSTRAEFLLYGHVTQFNDKSVLECRMWDVAAERQIVAKRLALQDKPPRLVGHYFSEEVVRYLTGAPGIATSQICFSRGETGKKELFVADYDGANLKQVTRHNSISILPKMSPDGRKIAYMSFKDRYPFLYVLNLETGESAPLSKKVGMNAAPAWAPDGKKLAIVLSIDTNAEIYLVNPDGSGGQRITNDRSADTSPTFHPNGQEIAFVSERLASAQIYAMNLDGGNVRRLSYQGGRSYDPTWSPNGEHIAYVVERRGEGMEIYVMGANGRDPRRLTESTGSNESPAWSADSRHVIFASSRSGTWQLYTANVETGETRRVPSLGARCQGSDWGPRRDWMFVNKAPSGGTQGR